MIYRLNIQEGRDYYLVKVVRRKGPTHKWEKFKLLRYVNVFLHECIKPESKGKVKYKLNSAISALVFPVPKAKTKPFPAPPPFKKSQNEYNEPGINQYFARILKSNQGLSWNLRKAVYTTPIPAKLEEKLVMRCMVHTYGGELLDTNDVDELTDHLKNLGAGSPNKNPQLVGFLGHGLTTMLNIRYYYDHEIEKKKKGKIVTITQRIWVRVRKRDTIQGRVIVGRQQILEDLSTDPRLVREIKDKIKVAFLKDKRIKKLIKKSEVSESEFDLPIDEVKKLIHDLPLQNNQVLLTDQQILDSLGELRKNLSPLAVIGIYHCHNGRRTRFLQMFANSVRRPVFAYTGFLGWAYESRKRIGLKNIKKNWADVVTKRLVQQEFNYQEEKFTNAPGDWVMATPMKVRIAQIIQDASGRSALAKLGNQPTILTKRAITFTVEISQGAPSKYQWYEDNNPIGENTAQLRIVKDKPGTYSYRCKVTDSIGATADSNLVKLKVS